MSPTECTRERKELTCVDASLISNWYPLRNGDDQWDLLLDGLKYRLSSECRRNKDGDGIDVSQLFLCLFAIQPL